MASILISIDGPEAIVKFESQLGSAEPSWDTERQAIIAREIVAKYS